MSNNELDKNLMRDHDYDGIQELDNPLPKWWLFTFYAAMVFSAFYIPYYHFFGGLNPRDEYKISMEQLEATRAKAPKEQSEEKLAAALTDKQAIALGQGVFAAKCVACHGAQGQGVVGPNLTDDYWINGDGTAKAVATIVRDGVPAKGMPPWGNMISPDEVTHVVAYVMSIHGSNPPNPKAPQGERKEVASK